MIGTAHAKNVPSLIMLTKTLQNKNNDSLKEWKNNINIKLPPSTKIASIQDNNNDINNDDKDATI